MRTLTRALLLTTLMAACATEPADHTVPMPPDKGLHQILNVPGGSGAVALVFGPGSSFMQTGPTAPGNASFVAAPYTEDEPMNAGTGSLHVTVDGQLYDAPTVESFSIGLTDDNGAPYLALVGYAEHPGPSASTIVDEVIVIVPSSDFAVGATVQLDGNERIALFAHGDVADQAPSVFAAAVTGSVTFSAGSATVGGAISATVNGDFGSIDFVPGSGGGSGSGTITDGAYTLAVNGPAEVYCDGSLAGQEAAFASITAASLGLTGGSVTLTNTTPAVSIAGAPIAAGFGAASLDLEAQDDVFAGFTNENAPGPAGTTFVGKYLVLDGGSATPTFVNAGVGAGYVTASNDGQCSVAFGASLTAP